MTTASVDARSLSRTQSFLATFQIAVLFFIFGFVTWVNALLIPYFKIACELTNLQSWLVTFAFYISYFFFSVPSSYLLKRYGFKKGMMVGFWVMSLGAFIFVPAALIRSYPVFLLGLFSIGIGLAILQTAANPYITILGPKERAAQRLSIMGIFNKAAGIIAPLVLASIILRATDDTLVKELPFMADAFKAEKLDEFVRRVIPPYAVVGGILLVLGFLVRYSPLPEIETEKEDHDIAIANSGKQRITQFPHLVLGAVAIFLHVGSQVIAVESIVVYAMDMELPLSEAKIFPSYTLTAQICGYILGIILIPKFISQVNALRFCTVLGVVLTILIVVSVKQVTFLGHTSDISLWFVALLGFANSMLWAGIWPLALDGLGRFTKIGASLLIMGLCGNAIVPLFYGYVADATDLRHAYWVLLPCYVYLVFYAFYGHKLRTWAR
ncbi:MAG TPA: sugar MFS transporter [Cyclobacteriaceae bacterium]|nr:sugar MFS transporter [Cyclobacteriaceae bacterium]